MAFRFQALLRKCWSVISRFDLIALTVTAREKPSRCRLLFRRVFPQSDAPEQSESATVRRGKEERLVLLCRP